MKEKLTHIISSIEFTILFLITFKLALFINFEFFNPNPSQKTLQLLKECSIYSGILAVVMINLASIFCLQYFNQKINQIDTHK